MLGVDISIVVMVVEVCTVELFRYRKLVRELGKILDGILYLPCDSERPPECTDSDFSIAVTTLVDGDDSGRLGGLGDLERGLSPLLLKVRSMLSMRRRNQPELEEFEISDIWSNSNVKAMTGQCF